MLLLLLLSPEAGAAPPPRCQWSSAPDGVLLPSEAQVPTNAAFFIVYDGWYPLSIAEAGTSSTVASEVTTTRLGPMMERRLLQLRPERPLAPQTRYEIHLRGEPLQTFLTTTSSDAEPPPPPTIRAIRSHTNPYEVCADTGVKVYLEAPPEPVILLLEDVSGGLVAAALGAAGRRVTLFIPSPPERYFQVTAVAVDYAGNRSDPTPLVSEWVQSIEWPEDPWGPSPASSPQAKEDREAGGCVCAGAPPARSGLVGLLMLELLLLIHLRAQAATKPNQ